MSDGKLVNLTERFETALVYASRLHAGQVRKGNDTPYIAHLLGVTALVLEDGGSEDEAIAALLHDAVEDQGGLAILQEIENRFGKHVAHIVEGLTDSYTIPKRPWRERKVEYIEHMRHASPEVRRVSLADKLHNARSTLADIRRSGEAGWDRFNGGKQGTLWYYNELIKVFRAYGKNYLLEELERVVAEIEQLAGTKTGI